MTKEKLQLKIEALQEALKTKLQEQNAYQNQVDTLKKQLADLNKPKLTPLQFDKLTESVEEGVGNFDFDDTDNYSVDFQIDYDNRIAVECLAFDGADEVVRSIMESIEDMFAEATEDDSDNS
tara:strand:- start:88 stop:453 length:366 start_codon:yes stop_codon:yes gene_type:complete